MYFKYLAMLKFPHYILEHRNYKKSRGGGARRGKGSDDCDSLYRCDPSGNSVWYTHTSFADSQDSLHVTSPCYELQRPLLTQG